MGNTIKINEVSKNVSIFPIGAVYISVSSVNPGSYFGGSWEQIAKGRTLVGVDTNDDDFKTVKKTGGEKKHLLTLNEIPNQVLSGYCASNKKNWSTGVWKDNSSYVYATNTIENSGLATGNQLHNNLQPYFTCYIWCRVS